MKRILIVDDSRVTRELLKVYLIAKDVTIYEAADGQEALAFVRARAPDLVIADMCMPRLDGGELCAALWKDPSTRAIPVLVLTASCDAETRRRAQAAGAREVLHKPIQPHALLDAVRRHVAGAPARAAPHVPARSAPIALR